MNLHLTTSARDRLLELATSPPSSAPLLEQAQEQILERDRQLAGAYASTEAAWSALEAADEALVELIDGDEELPSSSHRALTAIHEQLAPILAGLVTMLVDLESEPADYLLDRLGDLARDLEASPSHRALIA